MSQIVVLVSLLLCKSSREESARRKFSPFGFRSSYSWRQGAQPEILGRSQFDTRKLEILTTQHLQQPGTFSSSCFDIVGQDVDLRASRTLRLSNLHRIRESIRTAANAVRRLSLTARVTCSVASPALSPSSFSTVRRSLLCDARPSTSRASSSALSVRCLETAILSRAN